VRWWSDFNRVYYHPRSAIQFSQYQLDVSSFDSFTQGIELFHEVDKVCPYSALIQDEDILDRDVRPFVEESDSLQGFQVLLESDSSWAGFGAEYLTALRGEYPKVPIWTWGIETEKVFSLSSLTLDECCQETHIRSTDVFSVREYNSLYATRSTTSHTSINLGGSVVVLACVGSVFHGI
jgi:hypothetical protein